MANFIAVVSLIVVLFLIYFMVMLGLGMHVLNSSPYFTGEAKYYHDSNLDYPVYYPAWMLIFNQKTLYFDDYSISGDVVTVRGYWRMKGITWSKCDGYMSFKSQSFSPLEIPNKRSTVEILSESCR